LLSFAHDVFGDGPEQQSLNAFVAVSCHDNHVDPKFTSDRQNRLCWISGSDERLKRDPSLKVFSRECFELCR
jgi:hypothetical protein